ncbi:hypothetical protein JL09_g6979, partial [Pichia kudriavzevii]
HSRRSSTTYQQLRKSMKVEV